MGTVYADSLCKRTEKQPHGDHLEKPPNKCSRKVLSVSEEELCLESPLELVICSDSRWQAKSARQGQNCNGIGVGGEHTPNA